MPILYLSRYINQKKGEYHRLLQAVRTHQAWEEWVLYMLEGVEQTSRQTTRLIQEMKDLMQHHKHKMRDELYQSQKINTYLSCVKAARDSTIVNGIVLIQYNAIYDRRIATLSRAQICIYFLRLVLPKIYSQDLLNNLFRHPYTKIDFVMQDLQVHRNTATKYLEELVRIGLLAKHKIAKRQFLS